MARPDLAEYMMGWSAEKSGQEWCFGEKIVAVNFKTQIKLDLTDLFKKGQIISEANKYLGDWGKILRQVEEEKSPSCQLSIQSPYPFSPRPWAESKGLRFTLIKEEHCYNWKLSPDAMKKKILSELKYHSENNNHQIFIIPGDKFILDEFLQKAFQYSTPREWARIQVESKLI